MSDELLKQILEELKKLNHRSIELNESADIMDMLKQINDKLDERYFENQALNKRLFKVESEIERLTRQ